MFLLFGTPINFFSLKLQIIISLYNKHFDVMKTTYYDFIQYVLNLMVKKLTYSSIYREVY